MKNTNSKGRQLYTQMVRGKVMLLITLSLGICLMLWINIMTGSSDLTMKDVIEVLLGNAPDKTTGMIVWEIRIPMALMAIVVGASLAIGGCEMQTILKNPMASPYTLGISSAASFGAAMGIVMEANFFQTPGSLMVTINAFLFAMVAAFLIYSFSFKKNAGKNTIILFGIALNFLFGAMTMLLQYIADEDELQSLVFWSFGSLLKSTWGKVFLVAVVLLVCFFVFYKNAWKLTAMLLDDHKAKSLGVNVEGMRRLVIFGVSILAAAAVCFVGTIGFIGLVAPHIARSIAGEDQRYFMPISALLGALILSVAFWVSKLVVPGTILPVGLITSFIGIPFFVAIIFQKKEHF